MLLHADVRRAVIHQGGRPPARTAPVAATPRPSWNRSILTEIYLRHACSYREVLHPVVGVYPSLGSPCVTETYGLEEVRGRGVKYRHPHQLIATTAASSAPTTTSPSGQGAGVHGAGKNAGPVTFERHY
eukprot:COSAG01_NODE_373_length_17991_cov_284.890075_15_plen_129_part_00